MRFPLLGLAAAWAAGILLASVLRLGPLAAGWLLLVASAMLLTGLLTLRHDRQRLAALAAITGFALAGCASMALFPLRFPPGRLRDLASSHSGRRNKIPVLATVLTAPLRMPSGYEFDAWVSGAQWGRQTLPIRRRVQMRLYVPPRAQSWTAAQELHLEAGDRILAPVEFFRPQVYKNPGAFNYRWWLKSVKDIGWEGDISNPSLVQKLPGNGMWVSGRLVQWIRQRVLAAIDQLYPPWSAQGRDGAVLKAVLVGDRSSLDSKTIQSFRRSGLYHLLVISGLHVGLLAVLVLALMRALRVREGGRYLAVALFLAGYAALVEQRAATLRASLMIGTYLLARYLYRDREGLNAVGFAGLALLAWRPPWLFEAGFQLSFSAALLIFGLVVPLLERTTEPYRRALSWIDDSARANTLTGPPERLRQKALDLKKALQKKFPVFDRHPLLVNTVVVGPARLVFWVVELVAFSAALQMGLLMPMAKLFHWITFAGIGLNALAIPVMTLLLASAIPTVMLATVAPGLAMWPARCVAAIMQVLFALTRVPLRPWWLAYRVPGPPLGVVVCFAASLVLAGWALGRHRKMFTAAMLAFGVSAALVATYPFQPKIPKGVLEVTALDCGTGQATFVVLPDQTTLLMGACGSPVSWGSTTDYQGRWNPGEEIVSPYLWSRGLKRLNILVADGTTPGTLQGVNAVARNFDPQQLWISSMSTSPRASDLRRWARRLKMEVRKISVGEALRQDGSKLMVAGASSSGSSQPRPPLGLRIQQGNESVLVLNPISKKEAETMSVRRGRPNHGLWVGSSVMLSWPSAIPKWVIVNQRMRGRRQPLDSLFRGLVSGPVEIFDTSLDGAVTARVGQDKIAVTCFEGLSTGHVHRPCEHFRIIH